MKLMHLLLTRDQIAKFQNSMEQLWQQWMRLLLQAQILHQGMAEAPAAQGLPSNLKVLYSKER